MKTSFFLVFFIFNNPCVLSVIFHSRKIKKKVIDKD